MLPITLETPADKSVPNVDVATDGRSSKFILVTLLINNIRP